MLAKELLVGIKVLARQRKGISEIARMLGCSRETVQRVFAAQRKTATGRDRARAKKHGCTDAHRNLTTCSPPKPLCVALRDISHRRLCSVP
jgi:transposase